MCTRAMSSMRVGIDVGGTHTDAVLMDGYSVVAEI
jgi:N-methylhydantoinase A/oxoprolinase/acetone carboxylase beta subunit